MAAIIGITEQDIFIAVRTALLGFGLKPATAGQVIDIIRGQVNRVPQPQGDDYVVIWPLTRTRLSINNLDTYTDTIITGSITGNVLSVGSVARGGPVLPGLTVTGTGVSPSCDILAQLTGLPGSLGTYSTEPTADVGTGTLYLGSETAMQPMEVTLQIDVHGPASSDNSFRLSTLMRDFYAIDLFHQINIDITPLYTSDPRQMAFDNGEDQVEERWIVELTLQVNATVTVPQSFADEVVIFPSIVETIPLS